MKKNYCLLFILFFSLIGYSQNFESFASGIRINNTIYNISGTQPIQLINPNPGAQFFDGLNLGTFSQNSSCASITAGEVKTWKTATSNICSVTLQWRVYPAGSPSGAFNMIPLTQLFECNTGTSIFDDGLGPCAANDQKWKDYTLNTNFLTGLTAGNYTLEVFYSFDGSDVTTSGCETTRFISNSGLNYRASFAVSNPTTSPTVSATTICENSNLQLTANPSGGTPPYTYNWTGPNGYTSSQQNPVISAQLTNSGVYSLTITDSCGITSSLQNTASVTVEDQVVPTFDAIVPAICRNGIAPILSTSSTNGITGTWNPAVVSNTATGTYTFTPGVGQCAETLSITIFVVNNVTPTFSVPFVICYNEPAPTLPALSNNGIVGTWSPPTINNLVGGSYTFTPNAGQCAVQLIRTITVTTINPTFDPLPPVCEGMPSPALPAVSTNGITGTWNPATISNTVSGNYVFTPNPGQCAPPFTLSVTVTPNTVPTFSPIAPICENSAPPVLPTTSLNGLTGTWNPAVVNNTATTTYTFTPNPGQCGTTETLQVQVIPNEIPLFDPIDPICAGDPAPLLPTTSNNGINGVWNPAIVDNLATGTYTFTPDIAGPCAEPVTITVTVNPILTPTFNPVPPICSGGVVPSLPAVSINGVSGTWNPAVISNTATATYTFTPDAGECAIPTTLTVTIENNVIPTFDPVPPICENATAPVLPLTSNNGITGTWSPAVVSNTATATYTFTPDSGQCALTAQITVIVEDNITPAFTIDTQICAGSVASILPNLSNNGITGTWNPAVIDNMADGTYTFTPDAGQCATIRLINVDVNPVLVPDFDPVTPLCAGNSVPVLPLVSNNGISGTWNPTVIDNMLSGTYTFTPNPGECGSVTTLNVIVNPVVIPTFDPVPPICENATAPVLPLTSNNGITGTWNPAVVSNTVTGTYTFTPDAGQCALTAQINVTVEDNINPSFTINTQICAGSIASILPNVSNNGITGTWNPAIIDNMADGTYTFTPDSGQCAVIRIVNVDVNPILVPDFDPVAPLCAGDSVPVLPLVSNNGISGTWSPAVIDNMLSGTYTFTPNSGECGSVTTLNVTVNPIINPTFDAVSPICENATAPILPLTSNNGITGTWNPAVVSNTVTGTYTFTPDAGQCALTSQITVTVEDNINPSFTINTQICAGSVASILPNVSNNGITGTWNPAVIDNMADGAYTFTPDAGQCAVIRIVNVDINPILVPDFDPVAPLCAGDSVPVLPLVSNNGISGTWSPAVIDNMLSGTYTFTPNSGECGSVTTLNVTVNPVIIPIFDPVAPICENATAPVLPLTSNNGISGTWNPAIVNNTATATYTFTPDPGNVCTPTVQLIVIVNENIVPSFTIDTQICVGQVAPVLATVSNEGITGTWNPAIVDNLVNGTYIFTPDAGQCALIATVDIEVNPIVTPDFDPIGPLCSGNTAPVLPLVSNNNISGTWNPAVIDNNNSGTYTFTPNPGECGTVTTLDVIVNPTVIPVFDTIAPICEGDTAPVLPLTSNNGITGTWNPAVVDNTTTATYTFTPDPGNICTPDVQLTVTINQILTPAFSIDTQICIGGTAPVLPLLSDNGITGLWNPAVVDNLNDGTYVFTPDAGQCATGLIVQIDVNPILTPDFDPIAPICFGLPAPILPLVSNNGISGTWNPANINNAISDSYTFTPNPGECGTPITINVTVNQVETPVFDPIDPICEGATAPILPSVSNNGISGTWNPAVVDNMLSGAYIFTPDAGLCSDVAIMVVTVNPLSTTTFAISNQLCIGGPAPILPNVSNEGYTGTWNPAVVDNTTTNTYVFTPDPGQCGFVVSMQITLLPYTTPVFDLIAPICMSDVSPVLPLTSNDGVVGTWNPALVDNTSSATYTFTPFAGQCATATTLDITVNQPEIPTFTALIPICIGETAPILPAISNNGFTGTWSPAVIDNTLTGTYTFTPDAGQCAQQATLTQTVSSSINVAFSLPSLVCTGSVAPVLPLTSDNGITGTWNPAVIDTTADGSYTFTPDAGQCDSGPVTINITVGNTIPSLFDPIGTICEGNPVPDLPLTSNNGITGTWNPAVLDNQNPGTYTFTPDSGQCGLPVTITTNIAPAVVPVFDPIPAFCSGTVAPILPTVSNNGVFGIWTPDVVDNMVSGSYTFVSTGNACYAPVTINIIINPTITPTFDPIGPLCAGTTAPILPDVSNNGISGIWSPAVISNMTSGVYTFTPFNSSPVCTLTTTITVTVTPGTSQFSIPVSICVGSTPPALPNVSDNGVNGTWNPATIDNQNSGTYIFTPNAGECASPVTVNIAVNPVVTTNFNQILPLCEGSTAPALPTVSTNGVTGTWNPAVIDTAITGMSTYLFTPATGQCGSNFTMDVMVIPVTTPTFATINPICEGSVAPILPLVSQNGVAGTWTPSVIDNSANGIYVFIPAAGQCAASKTILVIVNNKLLPYFDPIPPVCPGSIPPVLPLVSPNGVNGTWNPAVVNTTQTTLYTFTPNTGECAIGTTIYVNVAPLVTPVFDPIGPYCSGFAIPELPTMSNNGVEGVWNPATVTGSGTYTFTPQSQCGPAITIDIIVNASPEDLDLTAINPQGDSATGAVRIDGVTNGTTPYQYSIDGGAFVTETIFRELATGDHTVTVRDSNGCEYSEVVALVSGCVMPKGFSPNNDGKNDTYTVIACDIVKLELFNRWGTKVNSFNHYNNTWNGDDDRGEELPDGTYFYVADMIDGTTKTGWVYLNR